MKASCRYVECPEDPVLDETVIHSQPLLALLTCQLPAGTRSWSHARGRHGRNTAARLMEHVHHSSGGLRCLHRCGAHVWCTVLSCHVLAPARQMAQQWVQQGRCSCVANALMRCCTPVEMLLECWFFGFNSDFSRLVLVGVLKLLALEHGQVVTCNVCFAR